MYKIGHYLTPHLEKRINQTLNHLRTHLRGTKHYPRQLTHTNTIYIYQIPQKDIKKIWKQPKTKEDPTKTSTYLNYPVAILINYTTTTTTLTLQTTSPIPSFINQKPKKLQIPTQANYLNDLILDTINTWLTTKA